MPGNQGKLRRQEQGGRGREGVREGKGGSEGGEGRERIEGKEGRRHTRRGVGMVTTTNDIVKPNKLFYLH